MIAADMNTLKHAARLLEEDASELRISHNVDASHPDWKDEPEARAIHDDALCTALRLRMLAKRINVEKERADYAWRNTRVLEKAYQDERAKREALQAALDGVLPFLTGEYWPGVSADAAIDFAIAAARKVGP